MTPCEKLGYKVGDRFEVVDGCGFGFQKGDIAILKRDDGSDIPYFINEESGKGAYLYIPKEDGTTRSGGISIKPAAPFTPKDPIEYLKSAHADGDMIDPVTMLRECFGITKTERVVVEWSEPKEREIKVGDKVRIVGNKMEKDGVGHRFKMGEIVEITEIDPGTDQPYRSGLGFSWLAADDVEPV